MVQNFKIKTFLIAAWMFLFLACSITLSYGQKYNTDSLLKIINKTTVSDTEKVNSYDRLIDVLRWESVDNAIGYAEKGLELSRKIKFYKGESNLTTALGRLLNQAGKPDSAEILYVKALKLEKEKNILESEIYTLMAYGELCRMTSRYDKALNIFEQIVEKSKSYKLPKGEASGLNGIGIIKRRKGELLKALDYFQQSLTISDKIGYTSMYNNTLNNMAIVYDEMKQPLKAKAIYIKLIPILRNEKETKMLVNTLMNLGNLYMSQSQADSALICLNEAYELAEKHDLKRSFGSAALNLGNIYIYYKKYPEAEKYFIQSLTIRREINDKSGVALAINNLCQLYSEMKQSVKAEKFIMEAIDINEEVGDSLQLKDSYMNASVVYADLKNFSNAYKYRLLYEELDSKIYNSENNRLMNEMQGKYESEKKDQQNLLLKKENDLSSKTIRQQKLVTYFIIGGLALTIIFAIFIFRGLNRQRNANRIISIQKQEVHEQKEIIEEKQKEILDSIRYAKRIQSALLANKELFNLHIPNNFILFKPKDIVSGDFYWATEHNSKFYLAVCDSTGHGVPGAFMSLLNMGFLSEAIKEKNIEKPNEVFNYVRNRLVSSISEEEQKDGMDGILVCLDRKTNQLTYAAANIEPVLISNGQMIPLEKDKMPVGKGEKPEDFKLHTIDYKQGDSLYLYTDGYADQFGGEKGKKFKYLQLEQLLLEISKSPLPVQFEKLENKFEEWKGQLEQVDDVCIIGIKI
ncbi:MAG: tetratricopeptide repeat protein [Bacteroidia bacterium]